jgi:hypothetical protein
VTTRQLLKRQAELAAEQAEIRAALDDKARNTRVACESSVLGKGCGKRTRVRDLVYIQTHWYIHPYGCTEGDYWNKGEGQFDCPKCGNRNRLYNRPEVEALRRFFVSIEKVYDR